jgi:hypothetical protein
MSQVRTSQESHLNVIYLYFHQNSQQHTTLHPTAGLLLKLRRAGPWMGDQMLLEVLLEGQ